MSAAKRKVNATPYMTKRQGVWCFQYRVPRRLAAIYGDRIIFETLKTADQREAESRRDVLLAKYRREFTQWDGKPVHVIEAAAEAGGRDAWLARHADWQNQWDAIAPEFDADWTVALQAAAADGDMDAVRQLLADQAHWAATRPALRAALDRNAPVAASLKNEAGAGLSLRISAVCDRMIELQGETKRGPTVAKKIKARILAFEASQGALDVTDPDLRNAADRFLNTLQAKGLGISQRRRYAESLEMVTTWASERHPFPRNALAGLKKGFKDARSVSEARHPWSPGDVARIVAYLPSSAKDWGDPLTSDRSAALMTMIGMGCRPQDALQVRTVDVMQCAGAGWVFSFDGWHHGIAPKVRNDGAERKIKNADSVRIVPIPDAIRDVILAAKGRAEKNGSPRLFGEVSAAAVAYGPTDAATEHAAGKASAAAVGAFANPMRRLKKALGIADPEGKLSSHSFRHSMSDLFDRANLHEKHRESFLGHTTKRYGSKTDAATLRPMVDSLPVLGAP